MPLDPRDHRRDRTPLPGAGEYAGLGLQFALGILVFLFAGRWLDQRLGTEPWLLILGVFGGFGLSFYSIYRRLVVGPREREKRGRDER